VLGAIAALGKVLITTNVSSLTGFTTLARFGVTPTRRTTTGTGHWDEAVEK
jgi:hypothetical protein